MKFYSHITIVALVCFVMILSLPVFAQEGKACDPDQALKDIDNWLSEYNKQKETADPMMAPKYDEWIGELNDLRKLVGDAKNKMGDSSQCDDACVADQCSMIEIVEQQVQQIVEETESQIGDSTRFGENTGREVNEDDEQLGDDTMQTALTNPDAAIKKTKSEESEESDQQDNGVIGTVFGGSSPDSDLPPANQKSEASGI